MTWTQRRQRRLVGALLLAGLLASAVSTRAAQPAGPRPARQEVRRAVPAEALLARFGHLLTSLWGANGSAIDPLGNPQSGSPTPPLADNGTFIDPLGGR